MRSPSCCGSRAGFCQDNNEAHKRTVVVAEDESVNRMDLVAMLEDNGYEVVGEAANGEEAVELTRKFRPSVGVHGCQDASHGWHRGRWHHL